MNLGYTNGSKEVSGASKKHRTLIRFNLTVKVRCFTEDYGKFSRRLI
ncbi:unknown [[Mannheimia] succiniciproducens MBEL55E]|uniref:Uncharacterized protein n=1 Tax=Mannheimia succiniciproducens (strain KCTC 0769BP / MBEL55E) TaxID=221988 RepID=Q65SI3_MANSM|nr:unknown [[Mannheimia] succiniciproducens MBEL55E]